MSGLVLIYRKPDAEHLDLVRLGSHSEPLTARIARGAAISAAA